MYNSIPGWKKVPVSPARSIEDEVLPKRSWRLPPDFPAIRDVRLRSAYKADRIHPPPRSSLWIGRYGIHKKETGHLFEKDPAGIVPLLQLPGHQFLCGNHICHSRYRWSESRCSQRAWIITSFKKERMWPGASLLTSTTVLPWRMRIAAFGAGIAEGTDIWANVLETGELLVMEIGVLQTSSAIFLSR